MVPYGWEGKRTGHASQTSVVLHLRAGGLEEGDDSDEHPPTLSCGAWLTLPFTWCIWALDNGELRARHLLLDYITVVDF